MVKSKINPENVVYNELHKIGEGDIGYETEVYEMDIYNNTVNVVIGKETYSHIKYNIIFINQGNQEQKF